MTSLNLMEVVSNMVQGNHTICADPDKIQTYMPSQIFGSRKISNKPPLADILQKKYSFCWAKEAVFAFGALNTICGLYVIDRVLPNSLTCKYVMDWYISEQVMLQEKSCKNHRLDVYSCPQSSFKCTRRGS